MQRIFFDTAAVIDPNAARYRAISCTREMSRREGLLKAWHNAGLFNVEADSLTIRMDFESFSTSGRRSTDAMGPMPDTSPHLPTIPN